MTTTNTNTNNETQNTANDRRAVLIGTARKAIATVMEGGRKIDSGTASLVLALYDMLADEYIEQPGAKTSWTAIMARIPEVGALVDVTVKGKGKSPSREIMAVRRAWPVAAWMFASKSLVEVKAKDTLKRCNSTGEFFVDPAKVTSSDKEKEHPYIERSATKCGHAARVFFGGVNTQTRATKLATAIKSVVEIISGNEDDGLIDAVDVPAEAWDNINNLHTMLTTLRDERAMLQQRATRKTA